MSKRKLKSLIGDLTLHEQRDLIVIYHHWINRQTLVSIQEGSFVANSVDLEALTTIAPETEELLEQALQRNDDDGVLEAGVVDIVRSLSAIQRGAPGATLNHFLRTNLNNQVFERVYDCAGLKVDDLKFDESFPTEIPK